MGEAVIAAAPRRVEHRTRRFLLSGLRPEQVDERFSRWLRDPAVTGPLNLLPGEMSLAALRSEVSRANGVTLFFVGIFTQTAQPIGYYMIQRDPRHRTANFNVLVGETAWWGQGVVLETRAGLLDHFFATRGIDKAVGTPLARNVPAVFNYKRQGWRLEGVLRGQCVAADGSGRLDQLQFAMSAEEWAVQRAKSLVAA